MWNHKQITANFPRSQWTSCDDCTKFDKQKVYTRSERVEKTKRLVIIQYPTQNFTGKLSAYIKLISISEYGPQICYGFSYWVDAQRFCFPCLGNQLSKLF